jgi:ABC-type bacteriocin/lantibiotic exporter with double-glycine peptidase domain
VRRQTADNDCAPTAIANAFEFHHCTVGLGAVRELVGTTDDGSDEHDVLRALLAYGCAVDEFKSDSARDSFKWVLDSVQHGRPVLLCVDRWDHWVTVIGGAGRQVTIYDPARETGGTFVLRFKDLRPRWEASRKVRKRGGAPRVKFYGIALDPPKHPYPEL